MKIVFTTDQIYLHGGIEKVMATKANYFADVLKYEVYILTTEQQNNNPCYELSSKIKFVDLGVNYSRSKSYFSLVNLKKVVSHFRKWYSAIKSIQPNAIIVCNLAFDFYWTPFFHKKVKKIKEFHASRFFTEIARNKVSSLKKINFIINDFIESKYDKLVLLNNDEKKYYRSNNLVVIPNPIIFDTELAAPLISSKAIAAGRIAPVKGFENAIKSWKIVVDKHPDWQLDIFGQGEKEYIDELKEIIKQNNLEENVFINNAVSNLQEKLLEFSLYIMTSKTECFPMILLESLQVGLPIVSFDCPYGPRNIIADNEDGFLVENQNNFQFAEKVNCLIENKSLRKKMGQNGKVNVKRFSVEDVAVKWVEVLNSSM
jgi:glycosyltransferase involved in cell wall biosynthesis